MESFGISWVPVGSARRLRWGWRIRRRRRWRRQRHAIEPAGTEPGIGIRTSGTFQHSIDNADGHLGATSTAAETENVIENARDKLRRKHLDLIVANDVSKSGIGFGADDNEVTIIDAAGGTVHVPKLSKDEIAQFILDETLKVAKKKKKTEEDWY